MIELGMYAGPTADDASAKEVAEAAYLVADAMLAARKGEA